MSESLQQPSPELRARIAAELLPVRPLRRPWQRALLLLPAGVGLLLGVPAVMGLRHDAGALGEELLWGLSGLQLAFGLWLVLLALRAAVPGRGPAATAAAAWLIAGAGMVLGAALVSWLRSPTLVPAGLQGTYWRVCFTYPATLGLLPLLAALVLALRAFPLRPGVAGALAGAGVGLMVESGWRTYCEVSHLQHVAGAHLAAIVTLAVLGAVLARAGGAVLRR